MNRAKRISIISNILSTNPGVRFSLSYFVNKFGAAKTSISEDIDVIRENLKEYGLGSIETIVGSNGGVRYLPLMSSSDEKEGIDLIESKLSDKSRLLLDKYIIYGDILYNPVHLEVISNFVVKNCYGHNITGVMTMETKGIPLATAVARKLNVKMIVARKNNMVTDGNTSSVHYISGTSKNVQSMYVSKNAIQENDNIIIVDDYIKGGGTIRGMIELIEGADATFYSAYAFIIEKTDVKIDFKYQALFSLNRSPVFISKIKTTF